LPLDNLHRDFGYALRMLRKSPGFTAIAVLTLALGIGANTAIFSVVDAVLLRPLPYPEPDRLAEVTTLYQSKGVEGIETSQDGRTWEMIRDHATFIDSAVFSGGSAGVNFVAHGKATYLQQQRVGAGFFRVLGVSPTLGREFTPEEDHAGGPAVTVLSYALWRQDFQADPAVIGRAATLRGEPYTIVGVMPAGFQTTTRADLWTPIRPSTTGEGSGTNYGIVARLKPGATWVQADSEVSVLGAAILKERKLPPQVYARFALVPLQRGLTDDLRKPLLILWSAVGLVLLVGCVNIAGLQLARSASRTREIATRLALGSGRAAVTRQLLAESILLAAAGGLAGVAAGYLGLRGLDLLARSALGVWQTVSLDARVLVVTAFVSLLTSVLFGLAPALSASGIDIRSALVEGGGRGVAGGSHRWPRRMLVIGEAALSMVLLVGAGLLIRTFAHLTSLRPGFDATNVITAKLSLQDARYATSQSVNRLFDQSLTRIRELPGVESAAVVLGLPYERLLNEAFRKLDGAAGERRATITDLSYATPDFFHVLRIPVLRGRTFNSADQPQSKPVMLVNETFVKTYLHDQDPVGRHISIEGTREIVGVVGDVQQKPGWGGKGPLASTPTVYIPASQTAGRSLIMLHTWFSPSWVVRSSAPVEGLIAGMQRAVEQIDPDLPFASFRAMGEVRSRSLSFQRFLTTLLSVLAGLALLLAAIGIYGLIANSIVERTRELGIRMALGATMSQAMKTVAITGIALAAAGVAIGCVLARAASQALRSFVWGVSAVDTFTFVAAAVALLLVAMLASFIPALRVLRLDPAHTLRHE
jgi:predicted permease